MPAEKTTTLWRPTGPAELALVEASGWREWPARLAGQPIFYPVLNRDYATMIARDWNVKHDGAGFVTRFSVRTAFLDAYEVHQVGGRSPRVLGAGRGPAETERQHRWSDRGRRRVPLRRGTAHGTLTGRDVIEPPVIKPLPGSKRCVGPWLIIRGSRVPCVAGGTREGTGPAGRGRGRARLARDAWLTAFAVIDG